MFPLVQNERGRQRFRPGRGSDGGAFGLIAILFSSLFIVSLLFLDCFLLRYFLTVQVNRYDHYLAVSFRV